MAKLIWGELWQGRQQHDSAYVPHRKVGDLVAIPLRRLPTDPPSPVYRVTEVLGGPSIEQYLSGEAGTRHPDYCYFRGVLVEGRPVEAEEVQPIRRADDATARHLANLAAGD